MTPITQPLSLFMVGSPLVSACFFALVKCWQLCLVIDREVLLLGQHIYTWLKVTQFFLAPNINYISIKWNQMWRLINIIFIKNEETTCQIMDNWWDLVWKLKLFSLLTQYEDSDLDWIKKKRLFICSFCMFTLYSVRTEIPIYIHSPLKLIPKKNINEILCKL